MNQLFVIFFLFVALPGLVFRCHPLPHLLTNYELEGAEQPGAVLNRSVGYAFRYTFANTSVRLGDQVQRAAVRAGFDPWANRCPSLGLLDYAATDRTDVLIEFAEGATAFPAAPTLTSLRRNANGSVTIQLDKRCAWTATALTKAVAYQVRRMLGLRVSGDVGSVMSPAYTSTAPRPSTADSVRLNQLYTSPRRDKAVTFLPTTLPINGPMTMTLKPERSGTLLVTATKAIHIGPYVGFSPPEGLKSGLGGQINLFEQYSIDTLIYNRALMYRLGGEKNWRYCWQRMSDCTECNNPLYRPDV